MTVTSLRALKRSAVNGADPRTSDFVDGIHYPSSDGKPMAENVAQWRSVLRDGSVLECRYENDPNVMVAGNVLVYPKRHDPKINVAPDLLVAFGVPKLPDRSSYKVWVEGKAPDFVMEVASPGTWEEDRGPKKATYAEMGVCEYWLFDPTGEFFDPPLEGCRLVRDRYVEPHVPGVRAQFQAKHLARQHEGDPATGEDLRTHSEEAAAGREAQDRIAELEALVRRLRGPSTH